MADEGPRPARRLTGEVLTALVGAGILIAAFALLIADSALPSASRWSSLTTFGLLAVVYTLQGGAHLYDSIGRTVRQDWRALAVLLLLVPTLYASYSVAVGLFRWSGLLVAAIFAFLPALLFSQSQQQRVPTVFDLVVAIYFLFSLTFDMLPNLPLPPLDPQIDFFHYSFAPLLLLLLAARGWPGTGCTWFMHWTDLRMALGVAVVLLAVLVLLMAVGGAGVQTPEPPVGVLESLASAVLIYFLVALPQEILFRGMLQNGIERFAEAKLWRGPGSLAPAGPFDLRQPARLSLLITALLFAFSAWFYPGAQPDTFLPALIVGLGYGWVYQRTGKVTVAAVPHMLVIWFTTYFVL